MPEPNQEIRSTISQFIQRLYEVGDNAISHVTVTIHGGLQHFFPDKRITHFSVTKMEGVSELSYQDMELEAPIPNMVTIIATEKKPKQI
ncbi:hypothetical protein [Chitinophaga niabensis]|uniref:Uncharacterized protein n=1 Tax=Chitinophaga niabensis TaxID=536979 RepID=A0A1N6JIU9_9BACT|nr:hypothetical protein [Chitinophaga niabensis]SIO44109.1 hypothetical protein SAMN04488055_4053 [Chitinophaga niabensis]